MAEFSEAVCRLLAEKGYTQARLAKEAGLSQPYVSDVLRGNRSPSGKWANVVADIFRLDQKERRKLHAAAARDNGFEIELPPLPAKDR
jgi:transcriptional regulator with XRE-family HTH domain